MITAVDTNVLLDILIPNETYFACSFSALQAAKSAGTIVICDIVYAELLIQFHTQAECDRFLQDNRIQVEGLTLSAHFLASRLFAEYRRRGGKRTRILPDYLIAAHAQSQADRLVTRDRMFFSEIFPGLDALDPTLLS
jgi:predicted nucleic acid-binding protein